VSWFALPPDPSRLALFAVAGGATASLGCVGVPPYVAAGLTLAWAAVGWAELGAYSFLVVAPAAAVLLQPTCLTLAGWSVGAAGLAIALAAAISEHHRQVARDVKDLLRDAEHERQLLHRTIRRYPVLMEACLELSTAREPDRFAAVLCARARALLPEALCVRVFLGTGRQITCRAGLGHDGETSTIEPGDPELYVAIESRPLTRRSGSIVHLWLPLRGDRRRDEGEGLRGVLAADLAIDDVGGRIALDLLAALARLGGLGLAAVDLVDQARALALHDDLTGLYGQHEFLRRLDEHVAAARRHQQPLAVVMCDLDKLKLYNDTWGHAAGDAALHAVAGALRSTLPSSGVCCRYGGEEFAVLIPGFDAAAAEAYAERLRLAIAIAAPADAPDRHVTASLGVAIVREDESGRAALIRADAACYRAKSGGRNRVATAHDIPSVTA
jgi:diguanylate cyclase (GGDEF)-like protein